MLVILRCISEGDAIRLYGITQSKIRFVCVGNNTQVVNAESWIDCFNLFVKPASKIVDHIIFCNDGVIMNYKIEIIMLKKIMFYVVEYVMAF